MKWEIYKKMNDKQRLYWTYHFENKWIPVIDFSSLALMWAFMVVFVLVAFEIYKGNLPGLGAMEGFLMLDAAKKMTYIFATLFFLEYFYSFYKFLMTRHKEKEWLKSEGLIKSKKKKDWKMVINFDY